MATLELAIDLGSSNITIYQRGVGIVLNEASVAIVDYHKRKKEAVEVGNAANRSVKASLGTSQVVFPIQDGVIVNMDEATLLVSALIKRVLPETFIKPQVRAIVLISCGLTVIERRDIETVMLNCGIKDVLLVETPLALLAYTNSVGGLFVDIGGGTTEVASVSRTGIAYACSVNIGGNLLNGKIIDYFVEHYGIKIGEYTAEKMKLDIGSLYDNDLSATETNGRDILDSTPRSMEASAKDIKNAISKPIDSIIEVIENVLSMTPPELANDIVKKGIFLSGGTSELPGIAEYISRGLGIPVIPLRDYDNAVVLGGGRLMEDSKLLSSLLNMKLD